MKYDLMNSIKVYCNHCSETHDIRTEMQFCENDSDELTYYCEVCDNHVDIEFNMSM